VDDAPAAAPRRPLTVSIAVVVIMVLAGFGVLEGVLVLLTRYEPTIVAADLVLAVSLVGAAGILLSLLLGAVAAGVWRGSRVARILITVFAALALVLDVLTISSAPGDLWWTVLDAAFYLFVIIALWAGRPTMAFFRRSPRPGAAAAAS